MPELSDSDCILGQFNLLMRELLQGGAARSNFRPWEIAILLDIESSNLSGSAMRQVLQEYQNAVCAELQKGGQLPLRLSEYLEHREASRKVRTRAQGSA